MSSRIPHSWLLCDVSYLWSSMVWKIPYSITGYWKNEMERERSGVRREGLRPISQSHNFNYDNCYNCPVLELIAVNLLTYLICQILCTLVFCLYVCVWVPDPLGITDSHELLCGCRELNPGLLEDQSVLLTTEPTHQSLYSNLYSKGFQRCI